MTLQLKPEVQKFIDAQLKAGRYASAEDVVAAGLATLEQQGRRGDFAPGELDLLLEEGDADIERGDVVEGDQVFCDVDGLIATRRREEGECANTSLLRVQGLTCCAS